MGGAVAAPGTDLEAPVLIVSTGPRREETILRRDLGAFQRVTGGRLNES